MPKQLTENWTLESLSTLEDDMFTLNSTLLAHTEKLSKGSDVEFAESEEKKKPKCVKGTACGYSCINSKNQCSDSIKARDAAALIKSATKDVSSTTPKPTSGKLEALSGNEAIALASKANWGKTYDKPISKLAKTKAASLSKQGYYGGGIGEDGDADWDSKDDKYKAEVKALVLTKDTSSMVAYITNTIKKHADGGADSGESLHVAKNSKGELSGVMELTEDAKSFSVNELIGHPGKLLGEDASDHKGAGTALLAKAASIAKAKGKTLELFALDSAKPFYEKLGFTKNKDDIYVLEGDALDRLAGAK